MIDLQPRYLTTVQTVLQGGLPPDTAVWAFGSRVNGTAIEGSDLDLVVRHADGKTVDLAALKAAFRDSNLPFRVELLDWATIPEHFRREILVCYEALPVRG